MRPGAGAVAQWGDGPRATIRCGSSWSAAALDPAIKVIAPWRLWDLTSRTKLLGFAEANRIDRQGQAGRAPFSVDANLLHTSSEGACWRNPAEEFPNYVLQRVVPVEEAPDQARMVEITFEKGDAVAISSERMSPATILTRLNELGGKHGVGVLDLVENRFVGMLKSRGCLWGRPAGTILLKRTGGSSRSRWMRGRGI